ncbi:MAG TPA: hypothetical protein VFM25_03950 [Verrucomicrobiae bacterium]|nr:hypothetical protein [Verrucomicrobiae bacterium]
MKMTLEKAIGQFVRLMNETDTESIIGPVRIHVHGRLEAPDDDDEYYVRINETTGGSSGIGFRSDKVSEVYQQPSGTIEITLRG